MKILIAMLLSINLAAAQQDSTGLDTTKLSETQRVADKWCEKLRKFNSPALKKTREFIELRQMMRDELRDIKMKYADTLSPGIKMKVEQKIKLINEQFLPIENQGEGIKSDLAPINKTVFNSDPQHINTDAKCYNIPYPVASSASNVNTIDLSVLNNSPLSAERVKVEVTDAPPGLKFGEKSVILASMKPREEVSALFNFSIEKSAEVNKNHALSFNITDNSGRVWTKSIMINILPPASFELFQNYPNPFNPATVISYQLPGVSSVNLNVYDLLGREIATLVNEQQEPGNHQAVFDAQQYASGMYIYRLLATDAQNNRHIFQKKMILLR